MSNGIRGLDLYCEHVNSSHVHCNRHTTIDIAFDETPLEAVRESHWGVVDGELRCEEHKD
jgi:hypothetical protein